MRQKSNPGTAAEKFAVSGLMLAEQNGNATLLSNALSVQLSNPTLIPRIISQHFPSTVPIGCDKVIAYIPNTGIPKAIIQSVFKPIEHRWKSWFYKCEDSTGRYIRLEYNQGSYGDMIRLFFSPNQVLHGHNAYPAMPEDADVVMDLVNGLIKQDLWILGLPSVRSARWRLSGVDYNADRLLSPYLFDCLDRAFQALPFKYSSKNMAYENDDADTWNNDDNDDCRSLGSYYTMNGGKVQTLVHNLYDKEEEFKGHHSAFVDLVRGVVRDEIRIRGKRTLKRFEFKNFTIEEALRRSNRVAVFQKVLERHGLSGGFLAAAADAPIGKSNDARRNRRCVLLAGSFGAVKAAATIQSNRKTLLSDTIANIRREQRAAGQVHVYYDVNWILKWYAQEIFQSPAGCQIWQVEMDTPEDVALEAAIRLKLSGESPEPALTIHDRPLVAVKHLYQMFALTCFLSWLVGALSRRRVRFSVTRVREENVVRDYRVAWPMPP